MRSSLRCSSEDWKALVEMLDRVGVGQEVVFRFPVKSYDLVGIRLSYEIGYPPRRRALLDAVPLLMS